MNCVKTDEMARLAIGDLPPERVVVLEQHFGDCEQCARRRQELVAAPRRLAADPGEFDDPALVDDVMTLIRLRQAERDLEPAEPFWRRWMLVPIAAPVAAALVAAVLWSWPEPDPDGFHVRSGAVVQADRWVSIQAFRAGPGGMSSVNERVRERIRADDTLAFSYENRAPGDLAHLMVFAAQPGGEIFWYYPAWEDPADNPTSVPIRRSAGPVPLPDSVRHALTPGELFVFGIFSAEPLDVRSVERAVAGAMGPSTAPGHSGPGRLDLPSTGQHRLRLVVRAAGGDGAD